jgi:hypothetical protein
MPGRGGWPYIPAQCPHCRYMHRFTPFVDDSGYEIVGSCRHPRIGMELFQRQTSQPSESERCPLYIPQPLPSTREAPACRSDDGRE